MRINMIFLSSDEIFKIRESQGMANKNYQKLFLMDLMMFLVFSKILL